MCKFLAWDKTILIWLIFVLMGGNIMAENRIIKFRAWDKKNKKMHFNVGTSFSDCGQQIELERMMITEEGTYYTYPLDDFILMQYTSLKDKNGKDIYCSDIVQWWQSSEWDDQVPVQREGIVKWQTFKWIIEQINSADNHDLIDWEDLEIIGNIFENPNLLEAK